MASRSLLATAKRPELYVCARCAFRASNKPNQVARRWIGMKYMMKVTDAEMEWNKKATRIKNGEEKSMLTILEERGLIQTVTGTRDEMDRRMTEKRLGAYVGIDPTAASLHVGHLIPLMSLFWMYLNGYHTVSLLGGATCKIGDPTDRLVTREKTHASIRTANMVRMHMQLKKLWINVESYGRKYGWEQTWASHRELVNNNAWWNKLPMLEVLQVMGPGMRLGSMLARDTVKNKLSKGDGMSWAEFTYPIMQAWDWWHMFRTKGISMQIGGSDQFGNITAGIDAIQYVSTNHPDPLAREDARSVGQPGGFTVPLLTTASGQKFGKSAGNAIWLDNEETTAFQLYGYLLKTADTEVERYLKMFTFMPLKDISALMKRHDQDTSKRLAQHKLAREFLELVHGDHVAKATETQHRLLFQKGSGEVPAIEPDEHAKAGKVTLNNRPAVNVKLPRSLLTSKTLVKVLYAIGLAESRSEAHRLVESGGAYIGGRNPGSAITTMDDGSICWLAIKDWLPEQTQKLIIHDDLLLFRRSKHNIKIVQILSDQDYVMSGESYRGMSNQWKKEVLEGMATKEVLSEQERAAIENLLKEDASWIEKIEDDGFDREPESEPTLKKVFFKKTDSPRGFGAKPFGLPAQRGALSKEEPFKEPFKK